MQPTNLHLREYDDDDLKKQSIKNKEGDTSTQGK